MSWSEDDLNRHYARLAGRDPDALAQPAVDARPDDRPECEIQAECVKLMEEDGWRALRTDPVSDKGRGKGFGELGMADHLFMRPIPAPQGVRLSLCDVLYVEFKRGNERAGQRQIEWHAKERARGFLTWIANTDFPATVEGFKAHYRASGLCRSKVWGL